MDHYSEKRRNKNERVKGTMERLTRQWKNPRNL